MPKYRYLLKETTELWHTIEADNLDEANALMDDYIYSSDVDWGLGEMQVSYGFCMRLDEEDENEL